uniref:Putative secreted protein n=1 Tax=Anopheles darlingi TaxID=43151 RepID=A0A2M4DF84_ANODA
MYSEAVSLASFFLRSRARCFLVVALLAPTDPNTSRSAIRKSCQLPTSALTNHSLATPASFPRARQYI